MKNHPIGLFDSGVGGLTVLRALHAVLPKEKYVYLGDTARLPYGTKSEETIIRYALQCTAKLMEDDLKILVVACNTVSSVALPSLQKAYPHIQVVGVVEPGAKAACLATKNNHIAILGTESTIRGRAYEYAIKAINHNAQTIAKPSPLFVGMAEEGLTQGKLVEDIAKYYISDIFQLDSDTIIDEVNTSSANLSQDRICSQTKRSTENAFIKPDTLVLGCTHFPLVKNAIANVLGADVALVDSAQTTAIAVQELLIKNNLLCDASMAFQNEQEVLCNQESQNKNHKENCTKSHKESCTHKDTVNSIRFLTTDDKNKFATIGENFLGFALHSVELVDL